MQPILHTIEMYMAPSFSDSFNFMYFPTDSDKKLRFDRFNLGVIVKNKNGKML